MNDSLSVSNRLQTTPLLTDLYQLTMLDAYFRAGMQETAVFEFFVRRLPAGRGFLIAAGQHQVVEFLQELRFEAPELAWARDSGRFDEAFIGHLARLEFTGDVDAMPEGTIFFPDEPVLRVMAPMPEAQLVESRLINLLHFQSLIASKAARCRLAAPGELLVDFGMRRAHGAEAALLSARAAYAAGFDGTATVAAGERFGIPLYGTMAHSFVQCHDTEIDAFRTFARAQRDNVVLLIDTYDTARGAQCVVELVPELAAEGIEVRAVRIDSGDLAEEAKRVRAILDAGDCRHVNIFASGNLDEFALAACIAAGAPIDGYGVGTALDTSADAPSLDCVYKLQEYAGRARRKRSEGKATWPGRKQVYRQFAPDGTMLGDVLTVDGDLHPGEPLLQPLIRKGQPVCAAPPLADVHKSVRARLKSLPPPLQRLEEMPYPVEIAPALQALAQEVDRMTTRDGA